MTPHEPGASPAAPDGRPTVLVVGPTPPPHHGNAVFTRMLLDAPALRERFRVLHLDTADRRDLTNIGKLDRTNVKLALRHLAELTKQVRRERPDVVYVPVAQNALAYLRDGLFILVASAGGARVVTHLHGGWLGELYRRAGRPLRWFLRFTHRRVDRAWVLGEGLRDVYRGLVPPARVRVLPNGVAPREAGAPTDPPSVLSLGQLSAAKGVLELLDAAALLAERGRVFRLVLAGDWLGPDDRREALARIEAHGLADVVELPGVVTGEAKDRLLREASVFVLPSRSEPGEGQPLAILEAMAAGVPVVATPQGAIPDAVQDGRTGFLVPERDPEALARAVSGLLERGEAARRMGEAGRRLQRERFTAERCAQDAAGLLDEALGRHPARPPGRPGSP